MMQSTAAQPIDKPSTATPSVTFALCVEAGGFEAMTIRAIQSLRKFGGKFADCPVVAVTPRYGARLGRATLNAFESAGAQYSNHHVANKFSWYPYINKVLAALEAQRLCTTTHVCYIDADMIVTGEPDLLDLDANTDVVACPADKNIGSSSESDETTPYWKEISRILGLQFEDLPWVHAYREDVDIRIYFNAGMFCFRKESGFAEQYLNCVHTLLDAKISSKVSNIFFLEQASLGLAAVRGNMRWKSLPHIYNYAMGGKIPSYEPEKVRSAKIIHYHDMMWPNNWPTLIERLKTDRPDVHDWLAPMGPITVTSTTSRRIVSKMLSTLRKKQSDRHRAACRVV